MTDGAVDEAESGTAAGPEAFRSVHTTSVPQLLRALGVSLLVSTYQSGRLVVLRANDEGLNTHFIGFDAPMGIALKAGGFALGTRRQIWDFRNQPAVGARIEPAGTYDACYLPRSAHWTGDVRIHEMAYVGDRLWFISTAFSCLATIDSEHSFVPLWRPPFVSALAPEDRCHMNGMALRDGQIQYVTALGATDSKGEWRQNKLSGGVLLSVPEGEIIASGLCMPHSPRWHNGELWILQSGNGDLCKVNEETGEVAVVASVPGFARGLAFAGPYAFIGLSKIRESVFAGMPILEREDLSCGVWVVDTRTGATIGFVRFEGNVEEIFDVEVLAQRFPQILDGDDALTASSFVLPDAALAEVPADFIKTTS
jgi:uncharacterized protein (TIGR03032 family)